MCPMCRNAFGRPDRKSAANGAFQQAQHEHCVDSLTHAVSICSEYFKWTAVVAPDLQMDVAHAHVLELNRADSWPLDPINAVLRLHFPSERSTKPFLPPLPPSACHTAASVPRPSLAANKPPVQPLPILGPAKRPTRSSLRSDLPSRMCVQYPVVATTGYWVLA